MRLTPILAAALALHTAAVSLRADRVALERPVPISTVRADRKPLDGRLLSYDDDGFELAQGKNKTVTVHWSELGPPGIYNVRSSILGPKATGEQWVELGRTMMEVEGGVPFADRAFARAVKLDPKLKADVEQARAGAAKQVKQAKPEATEEKSAKAKEGDPQAGDGEGGGGGGSMTGPQVVGQIDASTWGKRTDAEQAAMVAKLKDFADAAGKRLNKKLTLKETKFFLFYSDLSPEEASNWSGLLDRMYGRLAELFGVQKEAGPAIASPGNSRTRTTAGAGVGAAYSNVWYGKALVFVFKDAGDYRRFQLLIHHQDPGTSAGICRCYGDGQVHIAFFRQEDQLTFAHVLVHESVHGFVHRFRSPETVPSWANEGLAEVIASELVPQPGRTKERPSIARALLQRYDGMGGMLELRHITGWQYPVAETLCAFMIRQNKKNYVDFIVGIKEGLSWEESLDQRYKAPRERLVRAYGESLGIKGLKE